MKTLKSTNLIPWLLKTSNIVSRTSISLVLLLMLIFLGKNAGKLFANLTRVFRYQVTTPQISDPRLIVKQMSTMSELTTSKFVIDTIVPTSSRRQLGNFVLGETKLLYIARGEVTAGLDLSEIKAEDIEIAGRSITIQLPEPEILDAKVDVTRSQVYDYDRGFLNLGPDVAPQLQTQAQNYTVAQIKASACEQDILVQANQKAVLVISQLMTNAGYTQVNVNASPEPTCQSKISIEN